MVFPVGGGGLGTGTLLSIDYFGKGCKGIGAEPYLARDAYLSMKEGKHYPQFPPITIGDGLRVNLGKNNFRIMR